MLINFRATDGKWTSHIKQPVCLWKQRWKHKKNMHDDEISYLNLNISISMAECFFSGYFYNNTRDKEHRYTWLNNGFVLEV